ncbi:MAG TPA: sigma-54 dependent transcriptional regulator [Candidatus Krumholzibacteria bacterium]|jgi:DNA-binding NtrC family response regulator
MAQILVVDDEPRMCEVVSRALKKRGHDVRTASDGSDALSKLAEAAADLIFTDQRMEPMDGMELLQKVNAEYPATKVVMMTAYGEVEHAVAAMKAGAAHYLNKPVDLEEVQLLAERLLATQSTERENRQLRQVLDRQTADWELIGESVALKELQALILRVAPTDATVLIRGESGTGKELTAKAIHKNSARSKGPFVAVNCAAIPDSLLESELFGYAKGAFTGADRDKLGLFSLANHGTIFLDEIGEANGGVQSKLLRVLEERKFIPVGGHKEIEVELRILAATHRNLEDDIDEGRFREDLFYRFNVFPMDLPPLRARSEDIVPLVAEFLNQLGRAGESLDRASLEKMRLYPWPGNVRELRNIVERAHILAGPAPIGIEHIQLPDGRGRRGGLGDEPADLNIENHERRLIRLALDRANGNKTQAAKLLGLTRRALYSRMERLEIPIDAAGEDS